MASRRLFDGAQIEIGSLPIVAPALLVSGTFFLRLTGVWKPTIAWLKVAGTWRLAAPYIKVSGVWR